jgi:hypothetical protein
MHGRTQLPTERSRDADGCDLGKLRGSSLGNYEFTGRRVQFSSRRAGPSGCLVMLASSSDLPLLLPVPLPRPGHASWRIVENSMTTLTSSGFLFRACWKFSGLSRRVIRRLSHFRSRRVKPSLALYQCRLFAFTLPTMTLFFRTAFAAASATA